MTVYIDPKSRITVRKQLFNKKSAEHFWVVLPVERDQLLALSQNNEIDVAQVMLDIEKLKTVILLLDSTLIKG